MYNNNNYWWVNHKRTFKKEFDGGYIWSPKTQINGSSNEGYVNLTKTNLNDLIFSYSNTLIKAVGLVQSDLIEEKKPEDFKASNKHWGEDGYLIKVEWVLIKKPLHPKTFFDQLKILLPVKHSPLASNGNGNQNIYLSSISQAAAELLIQLISQHNNYLVDVLQNLRIKTEEDYKVRQLISENISETQKDQLIKARIGQGLFRNNVMAIEKVCRMTGISDYKFLIASHIKPWRDSTNQERIDGNNGLLLSPHIDKLFDQGWITFSDEGNVILSPRLSETIIKSWFISVDSVGSFNNSQKDYLLYHRQNIFKEFK